LSCVLLTIVMYPLLTVAMCPLFTAEGVN
jgi:nitrate reductase NapE component